ncbi:RhuM family protein [Corynebacterium aurimucosum]|uniref:RhuM family protein n=1 Tax=Corynebacterium aurimucosum TaxID=169292 RepID=UPI0018798581|nr:RhuM family protein [Corynebacterium aurimucosum]MBE7338090.1 virulence RhuM family protein [Corynebacterium aurimucosum]
MTSPDQIALYTTEDGQAHVRLQIKEGTAWLNTSQMGELFDVGSPAINHHIREILRDGELDQSTCKKLLQQPGHDRSTNHYNLDMILAVGYRVRGPRGSQFRKWATDVLREYLIKGFALDDQRLKNDGADSHFDELLERIREIRTSERQFFRKICDVIAATSADYEERKTLTEVRNFFANLQNRLHFAIHGSTAAELIMARADHTKLNAGLTNWQGENPHLNDMYIAKNYLDDAELRRLNRLTTMYLDYAEDQSDMGKTLLLKDWETKTAQWLEFNERNVLQGYGKRTNEQAKKKARAEWDAYQARLDHEITEVDMRQLETEVKALRRGKDR